eukprot:210160-Pelagomonas_calceolata.AAC.1
MQHIHALLAQAARLRGGQLQGGHGIHGEREHRAVEDRYRPAEGRLHSVLAARLPGVKETSSVLENNKIRHGMLVIPLISLQARRKYVTVFKISTTLLQQQQQQ